MVSNVTLEGNMKTQQDYRFTAVVTWNPPVYPYKTPTTYLVKWFKEDSLQQAEVVDHNLSVSKYTFFAYNIPYFQPLIILCLYFEQS